MSAIYRFLGTQEVLVYLLLLIGALFAVRWLWRAWAELRQARYSLEKEFALKRMGQATAVLALLLALFCAEVFTASFIVPGLPQTAFVPTATLDMLSTPTGTISAQLATSMALTLPAANNPAGKEGCVVGRVDVTSPKAGSQVQGTIEIVGTADLPDFGFYKYEVAPATTDTWATISAGRDRVVSASLGQWDTSTVTPGEYRLRLVVTDNQGVPLPACVVPVTVVPQS